MSANTSRIDKWLWCVRLFKTRSQATEACRAGKVKIDGQAVKPSREVLAGQLILIQTGIITRSIKVLDHPKSRVGAALVPIYMQDLTPEEELMKPTLIRSSAITRNRGAGRPTKKERRDIGEWFGWD